jgi:hypothetical protein
LIGAAYHVIDIRSLTSSGGLAEAFVWREFGVGWQ